MIDVYEMWSIGVLVARSVVANDGGFGLGNTALVVARTSDELVGKNGAPSGCLSCASCLLENLLCKEILGMLSSHNASSTASLIRIARSFF